LKKVNVGIIFSMMISPKKTFNEGVNKTKWYFSLIVSGMAFGLFFLQTGMDLYKTGQKNILFVIFSGIIGLGYGIIIIPFIGVLVWLFLKIFKSTKTIQWSISTICLSYSGGLIYGILGIIFSLVFGWKTSIAFGVTGMLWAIRPMILSVKEMANGKLAISVVITTMISVFVLVSWSLFGQI